MVADDLALTLFLAVEEIAVSLMNFSLNLFLTQGERSETSAGRASSSLLVYAKILRPYLGGITQFMCE